VLIHISVTSIGIYPLRIINNQSGKTYPMNRGKLQNKCLSFSLLIGLLWRTIKVQKHSWVSISNLAQNTCEGM